MKAAGLPEPEYRVDAFMLYASIYNTQTSENCGGITTATTPVTTTAGAITTTADSAAMTSDNKNAEKKAAKKLAQKDATKVASKVEAILNFGAQPQS